MDEPAYFSLFKFLNCEKNQMSFGINEKIFTLLNMRIVLTFL